MGEHLAIIVFIFTILQKRKIMIVGFAIVAVFGIITFCLSLVITSQKEVAVIQRFGKFVGTKEIWIDL